MEVTSNKFNVIDQHISLAIFLAKWRSKAMGGRQAGSQRVNLGGGGGGGGPWRWDFNCCSSSGLLRQPPMRPVVVVAAMETAAERMSGSRGAAGVAAQAIRS